jgi:hypothetical protein
MNGVYSESVLAVWFSREKVDCVSAAALVSVSWVLLVLEVASEEVLR